MRLDGRYVTTRGREWAGGGGGSVYLEFHNLFHKCGKDAKEMEVGGFHSLGIQLTDISQYLYDHACKLVRFDRILLVCNARPFFPDFGRNLQCQLVRGANAPRGMALVTRMHARASNEQA
jgi:hypothetical protein